MINDLVKLKSSFFILSGEKLPMNERQKVFGNGSLALKSINPSDKGDYTCKVTQGTLSARQSVTVQVQGTLFIFHPYSMILDLCSDVLFYIMIKFY